MKILLGETYFRILDPKEYERKMPYPPLGTLYAASLLKELKHDVIFYDAMMSRNPGSFIEKINKEKPDLLILYDDEFNYLTKMCLSKMRDAAVSFIKEAKNLSIPVLVYCSDSTDFPLPYLEAGCDAIIYGEGESTLKESVMAFNDGIFHHSKFDIKGLKFLKDGVLYITGKRSFTEIDEIPDPDYSFVDIEEYRKVWIKNHGYFSMNLSTTRGCPYKCNWCAKPLYGNTYNSVSPERAARQVKNLKEKFKADHIWITDDIFGLKPGWIEKFSEELKKYNAILPYKCLSRPDLLLRGNTIRELKESGCKTIWIGAESGSQKILDAMDKGTKVEQIYAAAEKIHEAGIETAFFIQFGYPGENWNDILLTRKMILECKPDDIGISVSYPLPGTKFFERIKSEMESKTNWIDSNDLDPMFKGLYEKKFYKVLHRFIHYEYHLHKIISNKKWIKFYRIFYYLLQMLKLKLKINNYIKEENLSLLHQK